MILKDIFGGGSDTSSATITWAMAEMIKNPRTMEKVQTEVRRVFDKEGREWIVMEGRGKI